MTSTSHNAANQLTSWNGATLTYDFNGNLASDGSRTYAWDVRNRLAAAGAGGSASFQYDALGRRTSKTLNGVTTDMLYDGLDVVQELSGGLPTANMLLGPSVDEVLARTGVGGTRAIIPDALGSTLALIDQAGSPQTQYTYAAFGGTTATGIADSNATQYAGRENDGAGLYYYRARYYSPTLQRFISEDPAEYAGGDTNLFAYVAGRPIDLADPLGLDGWGTNIAGGAAVGFGTKFLDVLTNWTRPDRAGHAKIGRPHSKAPRGWERCFHLDIDRRTPYPHLNAEYGPLKGLGSRIPHARVPGWLYPLGSIKALRAAGYGAVGVGVALDAYDIVTAGHYDRGRAIGGAIGGLGGAILVGEIGTMISPGLGTVIGGVVGGIVGSVGGQAAGARY